MCLVHEFEDSLKSLFLPIVIYECSIIKIKSPTDFFVTNFENFLKKYWGPIGVCKLHCENHQFTLKSQHVFNSGIDSLRKEEEMSYFMGAHWCSVLI